MVPENIHSPPQRELENPSRLGGGERSKAQEIPEEEKGGGGVSHVKLRFQINFLILEEEKGGGGGGGSLM